MSEWKLISDLPDRKMPVLYYSTTMELWDTKGNRISPRMAEFGRDEAYSLGFFDGKEFCHEGTGHGLFEWDHDDADSQKPTHWVPLPVPPTNSEQ